MPSILKIKVNTDPLFCTFSNHRTYDTFICTFVKDYEMHLLLYFLMASLKTWAMITVLGLLGLDFFFYDRKILPCLKEFSRSQPFYSNWFQFSVQNGNQQSLNQALGLHLTGQMWTLPMLTKFFFRENTVFYPNYYLPMLTKVIWGKIRLFTLTISYQCLQICF